MMSFSNHAFSQDPMVDDIEDIFNKIDDPKTKMDTIGKYMYKLYRFGHFKKAGEWAQVALDIAEDLKSDKHIGEMKVIIARYYVRINKVDEAIALLKSVIAKNDDFANKNRSNLYSRLSYMLQAKQGDEALYYNYLADSIFQIEDSWQRFKTRIARADIYVSQGLYEKAVETAEESYELFTTPTDTVNHLWLLYRICQISSLTQSHEVYAKYAEKYIEMSSVRKKKFHRGIFDMGTEPNQHIIDLEKVAANFLKAKYGRGYYLVTEKLAIVYEEIGEYKKAYDKVLLIEDKEMMNDFESSFLGLKSQKYRLERVLGYNENALKTVDDLLATRDSFQKLEFKQLSVEMAAKYEAKEQEQEILLLNKEGELKDIKIQRSNTTKWLFGIGALALLLFSFYLAKNIRDKKKHNIILEEKNEIINANLIEKETLLKEIHHRVKNNLQIISSLLRLQSRTIDDPDTKEVFLEGQNRVESMALIHQNLYKENNLKGVEVKNYIEKLCNNLLETYQLSKEDIELKLDIKPINLDITTLIPLGLIINELFSNSLKYAFTEELNPILGVQLFEENNQLHLIIYDNGHGINDEMIEFLNNAQMRGNKNWGFGTRLIKTFAKKLEATIHAKNTDGTEVKLIIDSYEIV